MINFGNFILAFGGVVIFLLALVIIAANPKRSVNRSLATFLMSGFIWLLANLLTNLSTSPQLTLYFARSTAVGAILVPFTFLIFCQSYTASRKIAPRRIFLIAFLPLFMLFAVPTSLNIQSVEPRGINTKTGALYYLLVPAIIFYFFLGYYYLFKFYRKASPLKRMQLKYIFLGLIFSVIPAIITNGILPAIGEGEAAAYGPVSVVMLSIFTSIAIIKHQLLDIRLLVARSIAYLTLLTSLAGIFGFLVFFLARQVIPDDVIIVRDYILPLGVALLLAVSYQHMKAFFDQQTSRLFYRDAYSSQDLLDKFNKILASNIELKLLLNGACTVLNEHLKPSHLYVHVNGYGVYGLQTTKINDSSVEKLLKTITSTKRDLLVADSLPDEEESLRRQLLSENAVVVSRLRVHGDSDSSLLVFGPKKSGNLYSAQDINIIEIVSQELVIAIQNALRFEEIQKFNVTLQQKIDDATRQLRRTNEKLKALDETKDEFISMASHQLRTPLTSVKGYVSMVLEGDAGKITKQQRALLDQAFLSSQRMVYLIADLLNVSRLRTGKFIIEAKPTQLADVIEGEIQQLEEAAKSKNMTLTYHRPKDFPMLNLDETKIRQVIMNFADNALYYTPAGGTIDIYLLDKGQSIEFTVVDNGIGVPVREQHHLFTKFYRANNAQKARPDGTGLGLFMAKKVVVAQGGAIIFRSEEGKGSTFGFSFPKKVLLEAGGPKTT